MAWFGLTADDWAKSLTLETSDFDRDAASGQSIIEAELTNCEAVIRGYLPEFMAKNLRFIKHEIIVEEAYSGQSSASLGAPVSDASSLVLWKYSGAVYDFPTRGNAYVFTDYTRNGQVITFSPTLTEGDQIIASYATSLESDCPSLRRILATFLNYHLAIEKNPDMEDRYRNQYNDAVALLVRISENKASVEEIKSLNLLTDINPQPPRAGATIMGEPA